MMSKRNNPGDAVRRAQAAQIKKPFPWGTVAGGTVLALFLGGILFYAATNVGSEAPTPLKDADGKFDGLVVADVTAAGTHRDGVLEYEQNPPVNGPHNNLWQNCAVYTTEIPKEHAVHSLEHGAVWVTYDPTKVTGDALKELTDKVEGDPYRILSPFPGLKSAVSLQAWGRQLFVDSVDDSDVDEFLDTYTTGPQTPEKGAACSGGVSATGSVPVGAPAPAPAPTGSAVPSAPAATAPTPAPSAS